MKKNIVIALFFVLLCSLTACSSEPLQDVQNAVNGFINNEQTEANANNSPQETLNLGDSFSEELTILKSGNLIHTFNSARIVTSIDDIPSTDCFLREALLYLNENNEWETGDLPAFVQEDGSFAGAYVLLIDVTTTSENATNYTTDDLDAEGYPLGEYDDPYLFRVDTLGTLVALNHPENNELNYWGLGYMEYNSLLNHDPELPDNHASYRLEPGETIEYTIGFIIYEELFTAFDCELDFSQLYFNILHQAAPGKLIDLNLEVE